MCMFILRCQCQEMGECQMSAKRLAIRYSRRRRDANAKMIGENVNIEIGNVFFGRCGNSTETTTTENL
jgi:hypothetical protein